MHTPSVAAAASLFLLASALASPACKSKSENKKESSPPTTVPSKGSADPAAKPIEPPETAPPIAADAVIDCDALLTPVDVKKVCGQEVVWKKDVMELGKGPTYCSRRGGPNGSFIRVMLGIYPHTDAAKLVTRGAGADAPGVEKKRVGKAEITVAHVRKINVAASVRSQHMSDKPVICSEDNLKELARLVATRMP